MKVKVYACFWFLLLSHWSWAQTSSVTGQVTDSQTKEALPGVNVRIKGTSTGSITDLDGNFRLQASPEDTLILSFVGYLSEVVPVGNRTNIAIALKSDLQTLSEVVVVGYGTAKKKELTGAVSVVNGEAIESLNPTRLEQALQGQVAGVNITSASGSPGGALNIRIRGLSTNGDNNPLVLVDGIRYSTEGLAALNPNDIESINVLKDATAGIYGVQAANGVVLLRPKKEGKMQSLL